MNPNRKDWSLRLNDALWAYQTAYGDNLLLTLETHPSGDVHRAIHDLWPQFHKDMLDLVLGI